MRYVFVSYNYSPDFSNPAGWYKRTAGYAGLMECIAKDNEVINVKQINYEGSHLHNGVDYRFVDIGKKKTYFPRRLNRYVKNLAPDIVVVQGLHHPLQLMQLAALLDKKTKIIVHHHAETPFTGIKKYVQKAADRLVDAYLFASKEMGIEWVEKGNLASAEKIHEVMEVSSTFYPAEKAASQLKTNVTGNPVFLWVGRLNANKDPLNVVKAFLKFTAGNPNAHLYMIYHTSELLGDIKELLKKEQAQDKVTLVGKIEHDDLLYWYNSADFFISGSYYEGSGTAVCEAMSCGCVPIVTDILSFRMITDKGNCGLLYEAGNEAALLSVLKQTKTVDFSYKRAKCLEYFKSNLSFETIAKKIQYIADSIH